MAAVILGFMNARVTASPPLAYVQGHFANATGTPAISTSGGRFDNGACFTSSNTGTNIAAFPHNEAVIDTGDLGTNYIDGAFTGSIATGSSANGNWCLAIGDTGVGAQFTIRVDFVSKLIDVWRGTSTGTSLASSVNCPLLSNVANSHSIIAVGWSIDNTTGFIWIRINGTVYVNLTGIDTQNTANAHWNRANIGACSTNNIFSKTDHPVLWHLNAAAVTTLPVDARVAYGQPTGDNGSPQFTRNTGASNASAVDDGLVDGDTTYNSSTTVGHVDKFDVSATWIPNNTTSIYAVQSYTVSRIDDATPRTRKTTIHSGASATDGATINEQSSYRSYVSRCDNDPATAVPWVLAALQAADISYTLVS